MILREEEGGEKVCAKEKKREERENVINFFFRFFVRVLSKPFLTQFSILFFASNSPLYPSALAISLVVVPFGSGCV